MPPWSLNYWTMLLLTSMLFIFPAALSRPACGAPPQKKKQSSPKKHPVQQPMISPEVAFFCHLPIAEGRSLDFPRVWPDSDSVQSFTDLHYRSALYVDAAIRLQALGKAKACQDLLQLAKWEDELSTVSGYRAIVLCRMLFVPKTGQEFRRAETGGVAYLEETTGTDWPLEPIILIDQVPFIIALEYDGGGGFMEPASWYVQYCIDNCDWSSTKYLPLTQPQEEESLQKLYALPVWQGHLTANDKAFFAQQIAPLPREIQNKNK